MTARERLAALLAPDALAALEELVAERVTAAVAESENGERGSPWLSLREAAEYVGVSERTLERDVARGRLSSSTVGRRRLVHRDELDAYVRRGDGRGEAPATPARRPGGV